MRISTTFWKPKLHGMDNTIGDKLAKDRSNQRQNTHALATIRFDGQSRAPQVCGTQGWPTAQAPTFGHQT